MDELVNRKDEQKGPHFLSCHSPLPFIFQPFPILSMILPQDSKPPTPTTTTPTTDKRIGFTYLRPEESPIVVGGLELGLLSGIGQWTRTTARITLSGGFVPKGSPPTQEITVHLKAYLKQI
ncbi:unnamed protein product [Amoebophrya sp. A25]|nr:unnamed protein product [Amoebophrya sp. A25]|eukprot:GSA25T00019724001.1